MSARENHLPRAPVDRFVGPLQRFLHIEAASGVVLLVATACALALANSPAAETFLSIWKTPVGFEFGDLLMRHSLKHWINDGLMAVFFFVVGLEVKRELVLGDLREARRAALPIAGAIGGMVVPAGIYLLLQSGEPGERGWGIPMATDIAFVVGCMAVLGSRIPRSLRVFLLSVAIADDIGAILVIAIGYTTGLNLTALGIGLAGIAIVVVFREIGVRSVGIYILIGAAIWFAFHESGVHATIAGVILGLLTPTKPWVSDSRLDEIVQRAGGFLRGEGWGDVHERSDALRTVERAARETLSPLERLEVGLHPWVAFGIMPIFALANAGVPLKAEYFTSPVALAVMAGLVIGKPVGIALFSAIALRTGVAELPQGVSFRVIFAAGFLAGIGFTMSIFIAGLALDGPALDAAKIGALSASAIAAAVGMALLVAFLSKAPSSDESVVES